MNILGIIAEYNPFHNGHKYQIEQAVQMTNADAVVAVVSGNFVQRGEPAFFEKHFRAQAAIENGVDLVLELPVVFSSRSAEYFAIGGVSALRSTGLITHISFGCEHSGYENFEKFKTVADFLSNETPKFKELLKEYMASGLSFAMARAATIENQLGFPVNFIKEPNNILAIEYLKALKMISSSILPVPVARIGSGHKESATEIRKMIYEESPQNEILRKIMTISSYDILVEQVQSGSIPRKGSLDLHILTLLRTMDPSDIKKLPDVSEGLENKLILEANNHTNLDDFLSACTSPRYPTARIRRITASLLIGISASLLKEAKDTGIPYLKPLGFNHKGAELLKKMKDTASVRMITKSAVLKKENNPYIGVESRATDIFHSCLIDPKPAGLEYKISPFISSSI